MYRRHPYVYPRHPYVYPRAAFAVIVVLAIALEVVVVVVLELVIAAQHARTSRRRRGEVLDYVTTRVVIDLDYVIGAARTGKVD